MMISLVIPVYNEEKLIIELFQRVKDAMESIGEEFEVILVNDGSTDNTLELLKTCNEKDKRFKILTLSRNFGHPAAYTAGLNYTKGDLVAMMDGDLQDPPEILKDMYALIKDGSVDIVYGKRIENNEKGPKGLFIKLFHLLFGKLSDLKNIKQVGNFSLMTRKAVTAFLSLQEKNRYLPGLRSFIGFKQAYVDYSRPTRIHGDAKMSFPRLMSLAFDAIFSFSNLPVKICLYSGIIGIVLIFFIGIYILIGKVTGLAPLGWSSLILSIYFMGCVQLLSIGILGEYVYRIYKESQNRPIFLVNHFIE